MAINDHSNENPVKIEDTNMDEVDDYIILGSVMSNDNGASKDTKAIMSKARSSFCQLRPICRE